MYEAGIASFSYKRIGTILAAVLALTGELAQAQLTDLTQTPNPINAGIAKSLEEQVGAGQGDEITPGSSIYLINRDPARAVRRGRQLFQRAFTQNQGLGPRVIADSIGDISVNRAFGAGLTNSCASCHGRPRGAARRASAETWLRVRTAGTRRTSSAWAWSR
jgi:hypothetical protein